MTQTQTKNTQKTAALVEGAAMVALAFILSFLKIVDFPWGGSITVLSMLPIIFFALKCGVKQGLAVSFVYSLLQLAQGAVEGLFGWGLTPGVLVAVIFLDYILPYSLLGLAGLFKKKSYSSLILGTVTAVLCRFACHYGSGVAIWKTVGEIMGLNISSPWLYSFVYNGAYMVPELIFTTIGALYLFKTPNMQRLLGVEEKQI